MPPQTPATQDYDFIFDPSKPSRSSLKLPGSSNGMAKRAALVGGGLVVLIVLFLIVKGLLSSGPKLAPLYISVIQDQQALIHLVTNASLQQGLDSRNRNFAATAKLSLGSSQRAIGKYVTSSGEKIDPKIIGLKISTSSDQQLTAAASAGTYPQTFQEVMKTKLTAYSSDIQKAYKQTTGKKGRALMTDTYNQAQLLLLQLTTTVE